MSYEWNGVRERRMKIVRYATALVLAALLVSVAAQGVTQAI